MQPAIPKGKFSYAVIQRKKIYSLEELDAFMNPKPKRQPRKIAWLDSDRRKKIDEITISMANEGKKRKQIIDYLAGPGVDLITDDMGNTLTEQGITSRVYRVLKKEGLCKEARGIYTCAEVTKRVRELITPMIRNHKTYDEISGFLNKKGLMDNLSGYRLGKEIRSIRESSGMGKNYKRDKIIEMHLEGHPRRSIMKAVGSGRGYVGDCIREYRNDNLGDKDG